jgi:LemA protein
MSISTIVLLAAIGGMVYYVVGIYNRLVSLKNRFANAFSQIDVQLKRRYDLIPNLVETAKAYLKHERETLEVVIAARNQALASLKAVQADPTSAKAMQQLSGAEGTLAGALNKLNVVIEAYPELKANQNIAQISEELTSTENRIAFARQSFNDGVMEFNTYRQSFPPVFFAPLFGFIRDATLLEFEDHAAIQQAPKVSF